MVVCKLFNFTISSTVMLQLLAIFQRLSPSKTIYVIVFVSSSLVGINNCCPITIEVVVNWLKSIKSLTDILYSDAILYSVSPDTIFM